MATKRFKFGRDAVTSNIMVEIKPKKIVVITRGDDDRNPINDYIDGNSEYECSVNDYIDGNSVDGNSVNEDSKPQRFIRKSFNQKRSDCYRNLSDYLNILASPQDSERMIAWILTIIRIGGYKKPKVEVSDESDLMQAHMDVNYNNYNY
jgi:hypothetical protein